MELEFQYQKIVLRACMVIPLWFVLALFEHQVWGDWMSDLTYILISIGIMILLAPIFFKMVYRFLSFFILHTGKVRFTDNAIEFIFQRDKKIILKKSITNTSYEQISLYKAKIDKITIEYQVREKQKAFSLYSPDIVEAKRNEDFREMYQHLVPLVKKQQ